MKNSTQIRNSQLITTWGPGAVIPLPNNRSGIICGIDNWDNEDDKFQIYDSRLAERLKVKGFRLPPYTLKDGDPKRIPYFLFPTLYYCTNCNRVHKIDQNCRNEVIKCETCSSPLVPERFVVVSQDGHIDDLPVLQLLLGNEYSRWIDDIDFRLNNPIYRTNETSTTALSGIIYKYKEKGKIVSLSQLINSKDSEYSLDIAYNFHCPGTRPWFSDKYKVHNCKTPIKISDSTGSDNHSLVQIAQVGGTNIWIPKIISSILIPDENYSEADKRFLDECKKNAAIRMIFDNRTSVNKINEELAKKYHLTAKRIEELEHSVFGEKTQTDNESPISEEEYKWYEYKAISNDFGNDSLDLYVKKQSLAGIYEPIITDYFSNICLLKRMKETRALVGFYRLNTDKDVTEDELKHRISMKDEVTWLPAIQVLGEGVFIEFSDDKIKEWIKKNPFVKNRANKLSNHIKTISSHVLDFETTPKYLLIHTFAHLLINEMSKECGYGSSSLRERIYCSDSEEMKMSGLLIYTTSSSSEGSLGGLVREGGPSYLESIVKNALIKAEWCSADPVCSESSGQGPDNCNLAACHNCTLLPETSCETNNRFLDRVMLVGKVSSHKNDEKHCGFFDKVLQEEDNR